jgi:hypothetical protein
MIRNYRVLTVVLISSIFLLFVPSGTHSSVPLDLYKFLPLSGEVGEWKRDDQPQEYRGEDLYEYINGGAEIYHEYGFNQVIVQDFRNKSGKSISVEIFEMEDSESAYGIYTFKSHSEDKKLSLGSDAQLSDYYLNFWKANVLVTITGFDEDEETIEGLKEVARAVDAKINRTGEKPHLVSVLPEKKLITTSIKYFEGNLGLYNSYSFFARDIFSLKKGIKGDYEGGYSVYFIQSKDGEVGQKRFDEIKKDFEGSPKYKNLKSLEKELFMVEDRKNKRIFISFFEDCILIVMGAIPPYRAKEIFSSILDNIGK